MFTSTKLKYFIAVIEEGSLSKASYKQNISRTPMSRAISELESAMGTRLFIRKKEGMIPSKEGLDLYSRVAPFHKELERVARDIKKQGRKDSIRIAVTSNLPLSIVSHLKNQIKEFNANFQYVSDINQVLTDYSLFGGDILISTDAISSTQGNDTLFDLLMVTSAGDEVDPISSSVIYHDFCNSNSLLELFKNNKIQKEKLKKIEDFNIIDLIYDIKFNKAILIASRPLIEILNVDNERFHIHTIYRVKMTFYSRSKNLTATEVITHLSSAINNMNCVN